MQTGEIHLQNFTNLHQSLFWILKSLENYVWHKHMMLGWIEIMKIISTLKNLLKFKIPVPSFKFYHIFRFRSVCGKPPSPHIPNFWLPWNEAHSMSRAVRVLQDVDPRCIKFMKIAHLCRFAVLIYIDGKMHADIVACVSYIYIYISQQGLRWCWMGKCESVDISTTRCKWRTCI